MTDPRRASSPVEPIARTPRTPSGYRGYRASWSIDGSVLLRRLSSVIVGLGAAVGLLLGPAGAAAELSPPEVGTPAQTTGTSGQNGVSGAAASEDLVGIFRIRTGECSGKEVKSGSYFRMIQKGSTLQNPTYVGNTDSPCTANPADPSTFTPLKAGSDAGLATTGFQPHPSPAFDSTGGGRNDKIAQPQKWFGVNFSVATNEKDPQTGLGTIVPAISHDGAGKLSGDLRAFSAAWNNQHFNQGSPKPDGSKPGNTTLPTGTYDPGTKAFVLEWTSYIQNGPFDGFTGKWHLEGTFDPGAQAAGVQAPSQGALERAARTRVGGARLSATGDPVSMLGMVLFGLGSAGLALDFLIGRRQHSHR